MNPYAVCDEVPPLEDYLRLRVLAGLSPKSPQGAAIGLPNSVLAVTVRNDGNIVGMGRVIGDGGLFFQVTDIAVDPAHQGRGLGKKIMSRLMERLNEMAPDGSYVSLIADGEAHRLYAQFGFIATAPASVGMGYFIRPLRNDTQPLECFENATRAHPESSAASCGRFSNPT